MPGCVDETAALDCAEAGIEVVAIAKATVSAAGNTWPPELLSGCSVCMSLLRSCSELAAPRYGHCTADANGQPVAKPWSCSRLYRWIERFERPGFGWDVDVRCRLLCIRCTCILAQVAARRETVTVLVLRGTAYAEHGVFGRGQQTDSACLRDCSLDVASVSDAK